MPDRSTPSHRRFLLFAVLSAACSSAGNTPTGPSPAIAMAITPTSGSIVQGGTGTIAVTVTGSGGFTGAVTIAVTGAPGGVTTGVSNSQTSGSVTTANIDLVVGAAVAAASYSLTITASGTGVTGVSKSYSLTVTAASVGGYTIAASPATVSLAQGASGNATITIARTGGFAGSVAFTAIGMSSGLTAVFAPASTTANTTTMTLTATGAATTGTVTVTIRGTATGLADQTTTIQATVTASGGAGSTVRLDYAGCPAGSKPLWMASQDGAGAWTRVVPTGDVYQFTVASAKGGLAMVTQIGTSVITQVRMMTQAELVASSATVCPATISKTVSINVAGITAGLFANIAMGGGTNFAVADGPYLLTTLSGAQDFFGYRTAVVGGPAATDRSVILRDLDVAANGSAGTADFGGAGAITPIAATINVAGAAGGDAIVSTMAYRTGASCSSGAMYNTPSSASTVLNLFGIPAASQRATDYHLLSVFARNGATITRVGAYSFHTFAAQTVTLGAMPTAPTVTNLGLAAYKRLQAVGTVSTDYSTSTSLIYTQQGTTISATLLGTQGWLGGTAVTLAFPDFTAVSGWNNAWMPAAGAAADWTFLSNFVSYTSVPCVEGAKLLSGQVTSVN